MVIELPSACSVTRDVRGEAVHRLVDGVVENLPDQVVQAGGADAADVHAGPLADGLEPFENGDVFGCVVGHTSAGIGWRVVEGDVSGRRC